jgi:hypothetical protein
VPFFNGKSDFFGKLDKKRFLSNLIILISKVVLLACENHSKNHPISTDSVGQNLSMDN